VWATVALLAGLGCGSGGPGEATADPSSDAPSTRVRTGAEVLLDDSLHLVRGRRVGLITNHTGISPAPGGGDPRSTIDLLHEHPEVELVALFGPEHGIRGDAEAGERVEGGRDPATGLPVHSLYSTTRRPPPETLDGVDVLVFDIQDVGARYYTYVSTMALAMEDAGARGMDFVVLDRPDPIDGVHVQGNVLDTAWASFVGMYPVPMRHGMTPGELARLYVGAFGVEAELSVVPAAGWRREMLWEGTGLPWVPPSPNMPSPESALHYPGTCLFEGTNLSVGRGTERAFQWVGAPWLDGEALARELNGRELPGVRFDPVRFTPEAPGDGKFGGQEVEGVRFVATDPDRYDPTKAAVAVLLAARRASGARWEWRPAHFDRLAGTDALRTGIESGRSLDDLTGAWAKQLAAFRELRQPYLLYP
jgi:uncharacterized protein YbbC (DUF1343 family)